LHNSEYFTTQLQNILTSLTEGLVTNNGKLYNFLYKKDEVWYDRVEKMTLAY